MNTISKLNHMNLELNKIENRLNNLQNKIITEELNKEKDYKKYGQDYQDMLDPYTDEKINQCDIKRIIPDIK